MKDARQNTLLHELELERALVDFERAYEQANFDKPADVKRLKGAWANLKVAFVALDTTLREGEL